MCFCTQGRHTIEWMLKAAHVDQKSKRQLNLELWYVPQHSAEPLGANPPKWRDLKKNLIFFKRTVRWRVYIMHIGAME